MTMLAATLKAELEAQLASFPATEADAIEAWAEAYSVYFEDAVAGAVPVTVATIRAPGQAKDAMKTAMTGLATTGAAAMQAGVVAFWGAVVTGLATYFAGATAIAPPAGTTGLSATLATTFATNTAGSATQAAALTAIANNFHAASAGGTATLPGPVVVPIT